VREIALERGAIVPGKPGESKLVEHIFSSDPEEVMPPPKSRKTLTDAQKDLLRNWITAGAEYEAHWAYIPLRRPTVPQTANPGWVRNPIDAFILHTLESKQIRPSPEAPKPVLLRRLSLDLIGLPPTPEELTAFLKDSSPAAYEKQVNRLLASPHFGERMAVPWLDVVRFADTVGYHGDQNQNIFPYRDYVIGAFNRNKPFDQFTIDQIAGDLLPAPTTEQQVASGFNRLNMVTREGGAQDKEYLAKYAGDRVRTVSMAWLGSTMGCAECHDHKYDPFASKDFYQMEAFFADLKQWGVYNDYDYTPNVDLKGWDNDHPFPPEIEVDSPYLQQRIARLQSRQKEEQARAASKLRADPAGWTAFQKWRNDSIQFLQQNPSGWVTPPLRVLLTMKDTNAVAATNFTVDSNTSIKFSSLPREKTRMVLTLSNRWLSAIQLEIAPLVDTKDPVGSATRFKDSSLTLTASLKGEGDETEGKLHFYYADADHKSQRYANGLPVLGVKDRWQLSPYHETQTAVWLLDKPIEVTNSATLVLDLGGFQVASVRASVSPFATLNPLEADLGSSLSKALARSKSSAPMQQAVLEQTFLLSSLWDRDDVAAIKKLEDGIRECRGARVHFGITGTRAVGGPSAAPGQLAG